MELMVVIMLMGILAASVIPAMDNVRVMREGAARDDIARLLEITKARAMASGEPKGLHVDITEFTLGIVELNSAGSLELMNDPLTGADRTLNISTTYPGVEITDMMNGDGTSGTGIVWFDFESTPHTRDTSGVFVALNNDPVEISLSSGQRVVVHAYSGMVETP